MPVKFGKIVVTPIVLFALGFYLLALSEDNLNAISCNWCLNVLNIFLGFEIRVVSHLTFKCCYYTTVLYIFALSRY
jgi:hypothetical protein